MNPAVVVMAYNRPGALERLLASLLRAAYPAGQEVPLVISLDRSDDACGAATAALATDCAWPFGDKRLVRHDRHLGVVGHFRQAASYALEYGAVILLEDDLSVAAGFYDFAVRVLGAYGEVPRVAGCCLYALWFNGFTHEPFLPLEDGADVFFLRLPYTQGLVISGPQWQAMEPGLRGLTPAAHPDLHPSFQRFGRDEWFPELAAYLAGTGRVFCFPRVSLSVGWGDPGTHFSRDTLWLQAPVQLGLPSYRLPPLDEALAVYDGFYELLPERLRRIAADLPQALDVDINASKQASSLHEGYVLTTRPVKRSAASFGLTMYPPELNVAYGVAGREISLSRREDVLSGTWADLEARRRLHSYFWRRHRPSRRRSLGYAAARYVDSLRASPRLRRLLGG
jgi:hypothetical protein